MFTDLAASDLHRLGLVRKLLGAGVCNLGQDGKAPRAEVPPKSDGHELVGLDAILIGRSSNRPDQALVEPHHDLAPSHAI
jgi:hypothetical protein